MQLLKTASLLSLVILLLASCNSRTYLPESFSQDIIDQYGGKVSFLKTQDESKQIVLDITITHITLDSSEVKAAGSLIALKAFESLEEGAKYDNIQVNVESGSLTRNKISSFGYSMVDLKKVSARWAFLEDYFEIELSESFENIYEFYDPNIFTQQDVASFIEDFKMLNSEEKFKSNNLMGFQIGYLNNDHKGIMFLVQKEFEKASTQFVYIFKYDSEEIFIAGISTL